MRINNKKIASILLSSTVLTGAAQAQIEVIDKSASPLTVKTSVLYSDNLNPTVDGEQGAYGLSIEPSGKLVNTGEGYGLVLDYDARIQQFKLTDDNLLFDDSQSFNAIKANLLGRFYLTDALHFDAKVGHVTDNQRFGTGISSSSKNVFEPDRLKQNNGSVALVYGNETSSRYIALTLGVEDYQYEQSIEGPALFDISVSTARLDLAFTQSAVTRIIARVEAHQEDYDSVLREDSDVFQGLIGVDWRPTGKSRLQALVGMYKREFDSGASNDGASWFIEYGYKPSQLWSIDLSSAQYSDVSENENTNDTLNREGKLAIAYRYSEQWQYAAMVEWLNTTFYFVDEDVEQDEQKAWFEAGLSLSDRNSLRLRLGYIDVSSSDDFIEYSQSELGIIWEYVF